jgi:hypothetical protein
MSVSTRNTKAQILEHVATLEERIESGPSWADLAAKARSTATLCAREFRLLAVDVYRAGRQCRVWYDHAVAEFSRPLFKR